MTNEHSLSNNKSSFNMFCESCRCFVERVDAFLVSAATYKVDVNLALGENSKEPLPSIISTEASFDDDSNKVTLNANRVWLATLEIKWNTDYIEISSAQAQQRVLKNIGKVPHYLVMQPM